MINKLICISGMCGSGKSAVSDYLRQKRDFGYVRFGQITMDKIIEQGQEPSEALEREIREGFRKKHGMAAFAILNMPKFDELLKKGDVIGDDLMSWEEYIELKKKYGENVIFIAIYAPPKIRYQRLESRSNKHGGDRSKRYRSFTKKEAASRDEAEIENLHKAGPIAMADYTLINTSSLKHLQRQIDEVLDDIYSARE